MAPSQCAALQCRIRLCIFPASTKRCTSPHRFDEGVIRRRGRGRLTLLVAIRRQIALDYEKAVFCILLFWRGCLVCVRIAFQVLPLRARTYPEEVISYTTRNDGTRTWSPLLSHAFRQEKIMSSLQADMENRYNVLGIVRSSAMPTVFIRKWYLLGYLLAVV